MSANLPNQEPPDNDAVPVNLPAPEQPEQSRTLKENLDLQAKLAVYHAAIESEFNLVTDAINSGEAPAIAEAARKLLQDRAGEAARTIGWLAANADSESVRLTASKYILDNALGVKGLAIPTDPLEALVNELRGNDAKPQPTTS